MTLWILRPVENLSDDDDPWNPWYDKVFGFVVRAITETEARQLAHANAQDENRGKFLGKKTADTVNPWLDSKYSTCEPLTDEGQSEVIMEDIYSA